MKIISHKRKAMSKALAAPRRRQKLDDSEDSFTLEDSTP